MKKILSHLGYVTKQEARRLEREIFEWKTKVEGLNMDLLRANSKRPLPVVSVITDDPEPSKEVERKPYVARVAAFYHDILSAKLKRMISDVREQVMSIGRETFGYSNQEFDIYLKGTENAFHLIEEWGEMAISEKVSYDRGEDKLTDEERVDLKDKLK
jgi:hypothetical protein